MKHISYRTYSLGGGGCQEILLVDPAELVSKVVRDVLEDDEARAGLGGAELERMANFVHNLVERAVAEPFRAPLLGLILGSADLVRAVLGSAVLAGRRSTLDRRGLDDRGRLGVGAVLVFEGLCLMSVSYAGGGQHKWMGE